MEFPGKKSYGRYKRSFAEQKSLEGPGGPFKKPDVFFTLPKTNRGWPCEGWCEIGKRSFPRWYHMPTCRGGELLAAGRVKHIFTWNRKQPSFKLDGNGETPQIWFIIQLEQPFINGWLSGSSSSKRRCFWKLAFLG